MKENNDEGNDDVANKDKDNVDEEDDEDGFSQDLILDPNRSSEGKRRVRLPKALLDDYHVGRKKYKERNPQPEPKPEPESFVCTFKVRTKISSKINCKMKIYL